MNYTDTQTQLEIYSIGGIMFTRRDFFKKLHFLSSDAFYKYFLISISIISGIGKSDNFTGINIQNVSLVQCLMRLLPRGIKPA